MGKPSTIASATDFSGGTLADTLATQGGGSWNSWWHSPKGSQSYFLGGHREDRQFNRIAECLVLLYWAVFTVIVVVPLMLVWRLLSLYDKIRGFPVRQLEIQDGGNNDTQFRPDMIELPAADNAAASHRQV